MSLPGFFSSLMASVGGGQPSPAPSTASQPATSKPAPPPKQAATTSGSVTNGAVAASKRKAEGELNSGSSKNLRKDALPPLKVASTPASRSSTSSPGTKPQSAPLPSGPYRGTAKANGPGTLQANTKPSLKTSNITGSRPSAPAKPASAAAPTPASAPAPAAKKLGYQAIIARGKQAEQARQAIGAIKHKPVEKMTRKERLEKEQEAKRTAKAGKLPRAAGTRTPNRAATPPSTTSTTTSRPGEPLKEKRKPVDLGYKGTMRPSEAPAYKGTMRGPAAVAPQRSSDLHKQSSGRYASYSDEEPDDEEEEDYESDVSSDMEAGALDLEEEEDRSLRFARHEDMEALNEESQLKREKEERKRKLLELARKRRL